MGKYSDFWNGLNYIIDKCKILDQEAMYRMQHDDIFAYRDIYEEIIDAENEKSEAFEIQNCLEDYMEDETKAKERWQLARKFLLKKTQVLSMGRVQGLEGNLSMETERLFDKESEEMEKMSGQNLIDYLKDRDVEEDVIDQISDSFFDRAVEGMSVMSPLFSNLAVASK